MSKPQTYRKNPIDIEAVQFKPQLGKSSNWPKEYDEEWADLVEFTNHLVRWEPYHDGARLLYVYDKLHDTWVKFVPGDYILKGVQGEFYPCERVVFESTYSRTGIRMEHPVRGL